MKYRGALDINLEVRDRERQLRQIPEREYQQVYRQVSESSLIPRRWLAARLHAFAMRLEGSSPGRLVGDAN
jgi:hypothetical protein